jgi:hypothetical protein
MVWLSDNIACPMASSLGDIVTLVILATFARLLKENMGMYRTAMCYLRTVLAHRTFI